MESTFLRVYALATRSIGSLYRRALEWLGLSSIRLHLGRRAFLAAALSIVSISSHAAIPSSERAVLIDFYNSTNGALWFNNADWNDPVGSECDWFGVTCNPAGTNVIILDLTANNLTGTLPATLSQLTALQDFAMENNALTGVTPSLTGMTALRSFNVGRNQLSGAIPSLAGLTSLEFFFAYDNSLTGSLPSLTGLTALQQFIVERNQLTGAIPSLAGLPTINKFAVGFNQLTGAVPVAPATLQPGLSSLCPNQLTVSVDTAWDTATAATPWSALCTAPLPAQMLSFGFVPTLSLGGSGTVTVNVTPSPGSSVPIAFSSLTPLACSVSAASGLVVVLPTATAGSVCTIAANKAGDGNFSSAPQVQLDIVIQGAVVQLSATAVPALSPPMLLLLALVFGLVVGRAKQHASQRTRRSQ